MMSLGFSLSHNNPVRNIYFTDLHVISLIHPWRNMKRQGTIITMRVENSMQRRTRSHGSREDRGERIQRWSHSLEGVVSKTVGYVFSPFFHLARQIHIVGVSLFSIRQKRDFFFPTEARDVRWFGVSCLEACVWSLSASHSPEEYCKLVFVEGSKEGLSRSRLGGLREGWASLNNSLRSTERRVEDEGLSKSVVRLRTTVKELVNSCQQGLCLTSEIQCMSCRRTQPRR